MSYSLAGTRPSPEDLRDIKYASPYTPEELPEKVDLRSWVMSVEQQGAIGSCVANGVTSACELIAAKHGENIQLSRMFLYNATKEFEGRLGEEGLYTRDAYKVARKYGMALEADYPYDLAMDDVAPSDEAYALADDYRVHRYEKVIHWRDKYFEGRMHDIKSALHEGMPVGVSFLVNATLYDIKGDPKTHDYRMINKDRPDIGGHFMLIVGYDDTTKRFIVLNSWGEEWGDRGYGHLPYQIIDEPFCEGYVVRKFNDYEEEREVGVHLERSGKQYITATIVPPPELMHDTVKVWMAAKHTPTGTIYVRQPRSGLDGRRLTGAQEEWKPLSTHGLTPVVDNYLLSDDNFIDVMTWTPALEQFEDVEFFVGFGKDELTMHVSKVHEI